MADVARSVGPVQQQGDAVARHSFVERRAGQCDAQPAIGLGGRGDELTVHRLHDVGLGEQRPSAEIGVNDRPLTPLVTPHSPLDWLRRMTAAPLR